MRRLAAALVLSGLGLPLSANAAPPRANAANVTNPKVAAALQTLDDVEAQVKQLRRDVRTAGRLADARLLRGEVEPAPPRFLERRIELLKREIDVTLRPLLGQRWVEVEPALQQADRLRGKIDRLREALHAPRPASPPRQVGLAPNAPAGTGRITGHVVDSLTSAPLEAYVTVFDVYGRQVGEWNVTAGDYVADGLATGAYFLTARDAAGNHVAEIYDDIPCGGPYFCDGVTNGTPVAVVDGQVTSAINFALTPYGSITGVVVDAATDTPRPNTEVGIFDANGSWIGYSYSDANGAYTINSLGAGTYFALAVDSYYLDQLYLGLPCQPASTCQVELGTPIVVAPGATRSGIDFRLHLGGSISGVVRDETTGSSVEYGWVDLYDASSDRLAYSSLSLGYFQFYDLPTGNYYAVTDTYYEDYLDELYDNLPCETPCTITDGTPIVVTEGQVRGGVDFDLTPVPETGGSISGTITDSASGAPIPGVYVNVIDAAGVWQSLGSTGPAGEYRATGLAAGSYYVRTDSGLYVDEAYDNVVCDPTCAPTTGTAVVVTAGTDTGGIDFQLDLGGWITGRVTAQRAGTPVYWADVDVYRSDGTYVGASASGVLGDFSVGGLVSGTYFAVAPYDYYDGHWYASELYQELPCPSGCEPTSGTPIAVTTGQGKSGIDFTLQELATIAGRVTDAATGFPIGLVSQVTIQVYKPTGEYVTGDWYTAGSYIISDLEPGSYVVRTVSDSGAVVDQLHQGKTCEPTCDVTQGTPVSVSLDTTTTVDFALRRTTFADVPTSHWAWRWIEAAYAAGAAGGCATTPLRYCPDASVGRAQSAVFLLRAKEGASYTPPAATGLFADVPVTNGFAPWAEEIYRRGVTGGCATNPLRFCPGTAVTRGQAGPFLLLTKEGSSYSPPACGTPLFGDLPATNPYCKWAEELVRRGVVAGCSTNPALFCPGRPVTRAQMAVFLVATFALPLP